jgi:hypothetical protein
MKKTFLIGLTVLLLGSIFGVLIARFSFALGFQRGESSAGRYSAELIYLLADKVEAKSSPHESWKIVLDGLDKVSQGGESIIEVIQELEESPSPEEERKQ